MEEYYQEILNRLVYPIAIWKQNNDEYHCYFTNHKLSIKDNISLNNYVAERLDLYGTKYTELIETGEMQEIRLLDKKIILEKIGSICLEMHFPNAQNHILSTISHKVRTPLTNIVGILSILDDLKFTAEQKKYMEVIKKSSYEIIRIANDIVDILNLENGKVTLKQQKVRMKDVISACYKSVYNDAVKKSLSISVKIDDDVPDIVSTDANRLKQIILNLLINAIQFTEIGGVALNVSLLSHTKDQCPFEIKNLPSPHFNIVFKIKDTGFGISKEDKLIIDQILELSNSGYQFPKYNGLGLVISKHLCKLFKGKIWYKSEMDMGTIFYFTIPCEGIQLNSIN